MHLNPIASGPAIVLEEPDPTPGDKPRFGMSIDARDLDGDGAAEVLIGAPRDDAGQVIQAGAGFVFYGPDFETVQIFRSPTPLAQDLLGYRARAVDLVGDSRADAVFCGLSSVLPGLVISWDGGDPNQPDVWVPPQDSGNHFCQGLDHGPAARGRHEPLILGDSDFDPGNLPRSGRVLIRSADDRAVTRGLGS